jgi:PAS domain-containing protein
MTGAKTLKDQGAGDFGFAEPAGWPSFALALLNASSDGVLLIDLDGMVVAVNPAGLRLWRFENPHEVVGRAW